MATGRSPRTTSRRGTPSVSAAASTTGQSPATDDASVKLTPALEEEPMSQIEPIAESTPPAKRKPKAGAIQLSQPTHLAVWDLPVMSSDLEIAGTIQDGGVRPIAASHMDIYGTIGANRPVIASHLKVFEMLPGDRPVFYSDIHMVESEEYPGQRPVMVSDPALLNASTLPGNRPVASNTIDDAPTLMGFID